MNREGQKREARIQKASEMVEPGPSTEADYLKAVAFVHGPDEIPQGERVAGIIRYTKRKGKNYLASKREQQHEIKAVVRNRSSTVAVWFSKWHVEGWSKKWLRCLNRYFRKIAARGIRHVVFSELSRLIRPPEYRENRQARPHVQQLRRIERLAETYEVTIYCVCDPTSDFSAEKSFQAKRGQREKGHGGRPRKKPAGYKKARREAKIGHVLQLHGARRTTREIESETGVARATANEWIRKYRSPL